jgi:hypothetical protein
MESCKLTATHGMHLRVYFLPLRRLVYQSVNHSQKFVAMKSPAEVSMQEQFCALTMTEVWTQR